VEARVLSTDGADPREAIFFAFAEKKFPILNMHREILTIEDIFLRLTEDREGAEQDHSTKRKGE
jgi:ABC-2 type transport system ATP-binding protein